jgi:hypothetical protein
LFLKIVAVLLVMAATNAADQRCEEQWRMIDQVLCILRRTLSLLTHAVARRFLLRCNSCFA